MVKKIEEKIDKHSLLGLFSVFLAITGLFYVLVGPGVAAIAFYSNVRPIAFYYWVSFSLFGVILAILGLFQKTKRKLFPIVGLILNLVNLFLPFIFFLFLLIIRLAETSS